MSVPSSASSRITAQGGLQHSVQGSEILLHHDHALNIHGQGLYGAPVVHELEAAPSLGFFRVAVQCGICQELDNLLGHVVPT